MVTNARRLTLTVLALLISGAIASLPASANVVAMHQASWRAAIPMDDGPINSGNGNGRNNKNDSSSNSPTIMRGTQQISISISGRNNIQSAFCKNNASCCKILQRIKTSPWW
ncbi:hypothetical protein [Streptosporangium sp. NPDC087985]|uniref:hypothetical protein n=1 Tax=Streptosporangium sp. NPDC087985 TaxID=3366196 RepID=UPI00382A5827